MRSSVAVAALFAGAAVAFPSDASIDYYPAEPSSSVPASSSITVAPIHVSSSTPVVEYYPPESSSTSVPIVHPVKSTKTSSSSYYHEKSSSTPVIVHPVPTSSKSSSYSHAPLVTSVVYATEIRTITACPPTVTHCPANKYETVTVPLYTTVCPPESTTYVHPSPTKIPVAPVVPSPSHKASPSSQAPVHYYPSNGPVSPVKPSGTAVPTGYYTPKPTFTGAANHLNAGAFVAGLGAFVALFI